MPPEMITKVAPTAMTAKKLASVAVCTSVFEFRKLFTSTPVRRSTCVPANRVRMAPRRRMTMAGPAGGEVIPRRSSGRTPSALSPPRRRCLGPGAGRRLGGRAQPLRRLPGGQVALGLRRQLVADHELADGGRAQEGGEVRGVQPPVRVGLAVEGPAVPGHRVRERAGEQVVVAAVEAAEEVGQAVALVAGEVG